MELTPISGFTGPNDTPIYKYVCMCVCILHSANTLGKGMNLPILPPAICKITKQIGSHCKRMKNLNLNLLNCIKIDLVSLHTPMKGVDEFTHEDAYM